ncbi:MAG: ABC transporter ATP-binding protein [Acidobacteria bacterium]|nr:ABC transporter ATP-binding protein [Acidobacteriota bacterium]
MAAIETEDLSKDFLVGFWRPRPYRALDRLTLSVGEGEVFGFLGPNGAGKSTTLKLLMQLLYPTGGTARILGRPVGDRSVKQRTGFLPENPYFYDHLTAEELLSYFARLFGLRGADARRRVSSVLDDVGIGSERRLRLRQYSKGMIQRVGLAQALLNEPDVVFLDEPMSGLDPLGRRHVRQIMLRLRDRGCTVFFSSHILSDAEALCSRVAILAQGRLVASGHLSEILAFELRGWELVVSHLSDEARAAIAPRVRSITALARGRFTIELPAEESPDRFLHELGSRGAQVVSLNPLRETLEDYFVQSVGAAESRQTGL